MVLKSWRLAIVLWHRLKLRQQSPQISPPRKEAAKQAKAEAEEKKITIEEVRAVLAAKSQDGKRKEVKDLLLKYDSGKLSGVKPEDYPALLADAEAL